MNGCLMTGDCDGFEKWRWQRTDRGGCDEFEQWRSNESFSDIGEMVDLDIGEFLERIGEISSDELLWSEFRNERRRRKHHDHSQISADVRLCSLRATVAMGAHRAVPSTA
jgi:hypothetical protein